MDKYVVVCDCNGGPNPWLIAWITDERSLGGPVVIAAVSRYTKAVRSEPNKRGGNTLYTIGCLGCGKGFQHGLTDETAGAVLDKVMPNRGNLEVYSVPAPIQPEPDWSEEERRELREYRLRKIGAALGDSNEEPPRDPRWYPPATLFENRHAIPLQALCEIVRLVRDRGKRG